MLFSKSVEYALKAIIYINKNFNEIPINPEQISKELELPKPYLSKLLQNVVKAGFLKSVKGINGGFLPGDNNELTIQDLNLCIDGCDNSKRCVMGISKCNDDKPCPMHNEFKPIKDKIILEILGKKISSINTEDIFTLK